MHFRGENGGFCGNVAPFPVVIAVYFGQKSVFLTLFLAFMVLNDDLNA